MVRPKSSEHSDLSNIILHAVIPYFMTTTTPQLKGLHPNYTPINDMYLLTLSSVIQDLDPVSCDPSTQPPRIQIPASLFGLNHTKYNFGFETFSSKNVA